MVVLEEVGRPQEQAGPQPAGQGSGQNNQGPLCVPPGPLVDNRRSSPMKADDQHVQREVVAGGQNPPAVAAGRHC